MMKVAVHDKERGFTLADLMTALSIASLVCGLGASVFMGWLPRYRLKSAALALFSDLQAARVLAIKNQRTYAIVFETKENKYRIISSGPDGVYNGSSLPNDDVLIKTINLSDYGKAVCFGHGSACVNATSAGGDKFPSDNVSFSGNTTEFNSRGMANRLGYVYLSYSGQEAAYALATPTLAGVVRMKHWNGASWN